MDARICGVQTLEMALYLASGEGQGSSDAWSDQPFKSTALMTLVVFVNEVFFHSLNAWLGDGL